MEYPIIVPSMLIHLKILAVVIYRLTLHPLAKYPGPFLAKITSWYPTYFAVTGSMHLDIQRCHDKYGIFWFQYAHVNFISGWLTKS